MDGTQERSGEVIRSAVGKIMWVGRATVFLVGLAVVLALLFGGATMAFAAATGDPFRLGQVNRINDALTTLIGSNNGAMLAIDNDSTATAARALDLRVEENRAPMRVNSDRVVTNLNADLLDGQEAGDLAESRGYAHVEITGGVDPDYPSRGVNDVLIPEGKTAVYCFDLTFTPKAAAGSSHLNNSAVIAAATPPNNAIAANCPTTHRDAAVRTYGSNTGTEAAVNFQIIFE
jgi:hypothetical protein